MEQTREQRITTFNTLLCKDPLGWYKAFKTARRDWVKRDIGNHPDLQVRRDHDVNLMHESYALTVTRRYDRK
jgi:hypothetical protein